MIVFLLIGGFRRFAGQNADVQAVKEILQKRSKVLEKQRNGLEKTYQQTLQAYNNADFCRSQQGFSKKMNRILQKFFKIFSKTISFPAARRESRRPAGKNGAKNGVITEISLPAAEILL